MADRRQERGEPGRQPYRVRVSSRAKQVRLTLSSRDGLVVVVPPGFDQRRISGLLAEESSQRWLVRATARLAAREAAGAAASRSSDLPDRIELRAVGETWQVQYQPSKAAGSVMLVYGPGLSLTLVGATGSHRTCAELLRSWLRAKARHELGTHIGQLAGEMGLTYSRLTIRQQRSRWGSCSRAGSINLNLKLLFLPPDLVQYVLVHELCHLVEPNHSPRFWQRVGLWLPEYASRRRALREATRYIPAWLDQTVRP